MSYDFSCWLIKYNGASIYGKVYQKGSIKLVDDQRIPLLWNHIHHDPNMVIGHVLLENREDGIYVYGTLSEGPCKEAALNLIRDRGSVATSPYVNKIKYDKNVIVSGVIREVSLVPERIDPDESYYPVLNEKED